MCRSGGILGATARHAIEAGLLEMVGMTRARMADPHVIKKIMEGREKDIRPCVGATYCLDRFTKRVKRCASTTLLQGVN